MDIFWKSTPKKLSRYFKYGEKKREQKDKDLDFLAWNIGTYMMLVLGSMFDRKTKYPNQPVSYNKNETKPENIPEEQKEKERQLFLSKLMVMQANFGRTEK